MYVTFPPTTFFPKTSLCDPPQYTIPARGCSCIFALYVRLFSRVPPYHSPNLQYSKGMGTLQFKLMYMNPLYCCTVHWSGTSVSEVPCRCGGPCYSWSSCRRRAGCCPPRPSCITTRERRNSTTPPACDSEMCPGLFHGNIQIDILHCWEIFLVHNLLWWVWMPERWQQE